MMVSRVIYVVEYEIDDSKEIKAIFIKESEAFSFAKEFKNKNTGALRIRVTEYPLNLDADKFDLQFTNI